MSEQDALFDAGDFTVPGVEPCPDTRTEGERRKGKQLALISQGFHPLHYLAPLRLLHHPPVADGPTCGTCAFREPVGGGARSYPKCLRGYTRTPLAEAERERLGKYAPKFRIQMPWVTSGAGSDCRAWWPACTFHAPKEND